MVGVPMIALFATQDPPSQTDNVASLLTYVGHRLVTGQWLGLNPGLWQQLMTQEPARGRAGLLATIAMVVLVDIVADGDHDPDLRTRQFRRRRRQGLRAFHHRQRFAVEQL